MAFYRMDNDQNSSDIFITGNKIQIQTLTVTSNSLATLIETVAMTPKVVDVGIESHSPSSALMALVNINHDMDWSDFDDVVKFLEEKLDEVINEVHGLDKLLLDDGKTQLNCPPKSDEIKGVLLLKTLSEKEGDHGITLKREFKVHTAGADPDDPDNQLIEIREDIVKAPAEPGPPIYTENVVTVSICRKSSK